MWNKVYFAAQGIYAGLYSYEQVMKMGKGPSVEYPGIFIKFLGFIVLPFSIIIGFFIFIVEDVLNSNIAKKYMKDKEEGVLVRIKKKWKMLTSFLDKIIYNTRFVENFIIEDYKMSIFEQLLYLRCMIKTMECVGYKNTNKKYTDFIKDIYLHRDKLREIQIIAKLSGIKDEGLTNE